MENRVYIAIDLKSFYASVECLQRGLDPLTTNLVVADLERTEKTICLAVSPSLKAYGIPGRARLYEVIQTVDRVNAVRQRKAPGGRFEGSSMDAATLENHAEFAVDYIVAPPQMAHYMQCSAEVYDVYLKYIAPEDLHVYSIDEVFIDATAYLRSAGKTAHEFAQMIILDILRTTGITATAGIGTNLYLAKVAMDIEAKHVKPDACGVRIAELNERSYRERLWAHKPLLDFWRVGRGYVKKLAKCGLYTMGDIARCSIGKPQDYHNEDLLYDMFGVNAELLIDHAWGWEPCTMQDIKAYKPEYKSIGSGQVLQDPYSWKQARLVVREMTDLLVLDLVEKKLVTDQIVLTVGYDIENLSNPKRRKQYVGPISVDMYGRHIPKSAHGTVNFKEKNSSTKLIVESTVQLYDRITDKDLLIRRINLSANRVESESLVSKEVSVEQISMFIDYEQEENRRRKEKADLKEERNMQQAVLEIKQKFGKNAILRGMNLQEGSTARSKNEQIGGHKA